VRLIFGHLAASLRPTAPGAGTMGIVVGEFVKENNG
jgi:hypothetical protein